MLTTIARIMKSIYSSRIYTEDMKRTINNNAQRLWKKTKPVVEFGAGLILIALGTAIAAAEYFIDRNEKKEAMDDQSYDIPEEEISENIDNNVL